MEKAMGKKRSWPLIVWHVRLALNGTQMHHVTVGGLVALWALLLGVVDYPLYVQTHQLTLRLRAPDAPNSKTQRTTARKNAPRDNAKEFLATLPAFRNYPAQLRAITQLADNHGILVLRVDYRYEHVQAAPIRKLTLHMDLRGGEIQQRQLLPVLLNAFQNLSISRLVYTKSADPGALIELKLDINLYYRIEEIPA